MDNYFLNKYNANTRARAGKAARFELKSIEDLDNILEKIIYENGRYVFNIGGNNYRIVAVVVFVCGIMTLRFVGTHAQYDKIKDCSVI